MSKKNVRKYPRILASFPVDYTVGDTTFRGRATTLGGGGVYLRSVDLPQATEVGLHFRPARHLPFIQARARVRYSAPGQGSGLEFTEISAEHHRLILRLIHHKTGNRRNFPRVPLATQVQCQELMTIAFSRDLSVGGMFIETNELVPAGSKINVRFHLDDGGPIIVADALVKYAIDKLGMGVEFLRVEPDDRKRIEGYVERLWNLASPAAATESSR